MNIKVISAGAGSGKTYRLTHEMVQLLHPDHPDKVRPSGIIATTFTKKAAAELKERVRQKLLEDGFRSEARDISNALIGTVHSIGVKLLKRFAFEAGVSPEVDIIAEEDQQVMFNQSLASVLNPLLINEMEFLAERLGLNKNDRFDWRNSVRQVTELARANNFSIQDLEKSAAFSLEKFFEFLPNSESETPEAWNTGLLELLERTINDLRSGEDSTKVTQSTINDLQVFWNKLDNKKELNWHEWVKISKSKPAKKSLEAVSELTEFALNHESHPDFRKNIRSFIETVFGIAINAIKEYEAYKKRRGLIDYTDMEVSVLRLLENDQVKAVIEGELDLLMVDEFQDTNPVQLEIFLKLSKLSRHSVWVGDPKQSIYGFRGAEPALMKAIIEAIGGVKPEDIQDRSWRSRADLVYFSNALFSKAFKELPEEQVALNPVRTKADEPVELDTALWHWHFQPDGEGRRMPGRPWMENCIATTLSDWLSQGQFIQPKGSDQARKALPGDVAILCRSNNECQLVAEALHKAGMKASIARSGLLETAEAKLILACLKYILHPSDSLSVAEILLLTGESPIETIIENRLDFLEKIEKENKLPAWSGDQPVIKHLNNLREAVKELSGLEILDLVLEELDLRRIMAAWGNALQRMDNVDAFRKLALDYEETCNRLHTAASLGGLLLWINERAEAQLDEQGSGENENAVNVLTYHRSKGLEWPIVICHSLESKLQDRVWGMTVVQENETVNLESPLSGRWLRYWINPYADQSKNTRLENRLNESPVKTEAQIRALEEEARLLYVGFTRARDYLVLTSKPRPVNWLNRVANEGKEDIPALGSITDEVSWNWKGKEIQFNTLVRIFQRDFGYADLPQEKIPYLEQRKGPQIHPKAKIDLNSPLQNGEKVKIEKKAEYQYPPAIKLNQNADEYELSAILQTFITGDRPERKFEERLAIIASELDKKGLSDQTDAKSIIQHSDGFYYQLKKEYGKGQILRNLPVSGVVQNKRYYLICDLVLDLKKGGKVFIINAPFTGKKGSAKKAMKDLSPKLTMLHHAISNTDRVLINCLLDGLLIEVKFSVQPVQMDLGF